MELFCRVEDSTPGGARRQRPLIHLVCKWSHSWNHGNQNSKTTTHDGSCDKRLHHSTFVLLSWCPQMLALPISSGAHLPLLRRQLLDSCGCLYPLSMGQWNWKETYTDPFKLGFTNPGTTGPRGLHVLYDGMALSVLLYPIYLSFSTSVKYTYL